MSPAGIIALVFSLFLMLRLSSIFSLSNSNVIASFIFRKSYSVSLASSFLF